MKKLGIILMVLSCFMTLTQCKKKEFSVSSNSDAVCISLNMVNSSKVGVNTANGQVQYKKYDVVYVASDGKFVGTLAHNGERFTGSIEGAKEGELLFFYFLGNKHTDALKAGETKSVSVTIDDQTQDLPVISYGLSNELFSAECSNYSAFMNNQCALVKFDVKTEYADEPVCINGLNNKVEVDFTTCSFKFSQVDGGVIKMPAGSGERWAILFPNEEPMEQGADGTAFTADYRYFGRRPAIADLYPNDYITEGYKITIEEPAIADGKFSMNGAKRVVFAEGNVQYIANGVDKPYWKFADHQYDVLPNTAEQTYDGTNINRDRFGWGTGDNPDNVSTNNNDYTEYVDWGIHFPLVDGKPWHAPRCFEWEYVMFTRNCTKLNDVYNARYARATIETPKGDKVNGLILFPDVYNHPDGVALPSKRSINYTNNNGGGDYGENTYKVDDWAKMEAAGAVFLPAGGQRILKDGKLGFYDVNTEGHYWSQCDLEDPIHACNIYYTNYRPYIFDKNDKYKGFSVRLVHE